jgi:CheY-like chemotaxis protein
VREGSWEFARLSLATYLLVVDDDAPFRGVVCRALRDRGYEVAEATSGTEGLKALSHRTPDVLITDIMMPDGDGIEFISGARRAGLASPILAMSGSGEMKSLDFLRLAAKLGADATIRKPFTIDELLEKLEPLARR